MTKKQIIKKIIKFLGDKLVDYAKSHPIDTSNHDRMANRIYKTGKSGHTRPELQAMNNEELRELEASVKGKRPFKIPRKESARTLIVLLKECERFEHENESCRIIIPYLRVMCLALSKLGQRGFESVVPRQVRQYTPKIEVWGELNKSRDWLSFTAQDALQGMEISESSVRRTFHKYFVVTDEMPEIGPSELFDAQEYEAMIQLREALIATRLCNSVVCNFVTQHSSKTSATRLTANNKSTKTAKKESPTWQDQILNNVSVTTSMKKKLKGCRIEMISYLQQEQTQYMKAS